MDKVILDKVLYVQDFLDLANLNALYNFQSSVKDGSGNANHGTATAITYGYDTWDGKSAIFNGTSSKVTIPDDNSIDLSGQFHIFIWAKWTATASGSLFSRSIFALYSPPYNPSALNVTITSAVTPEGIIIYGVP